MRKCQDCDNELKLVKFKDAYGVLYCDSCHNIEHYECPHIDTGIRKFITSNGAVQVKAFCNDCKKTFGSALRHSDYNLGEIRLIDKDSYNAFHDEAYNEYLKFRDECLRKKAFIKELKGEEYSARYHEYLRSEKWRAKVELVMRRDDYLCRACLLERATEVHHLTYERIYNEPLYDLVAICRGCHEKIHNIPT